MAKATGCKALRLTAQYLAKAAMALFMAPGARQAAAQPLPPDAPPNVRAIMAKQTKFCESGKGTELNAPGHEPIVYFGNATNGGCLGKLYIKDY